MAILDNVLKGVKMDNKNRQAKSALKDGLRKLNKYQLKLFYGVLVHYWAKYRVFISKQKCLNVIFEIFFFDSNKTVQIGIVDIEGIHITDFVVGQRLAGIVVFNSRHNKLLLFLKLIGRRARQHIIQYEISNFCIFSKNNIIFPKIEKKNMHEAIFE